MTRIRRAVVATAVAAVTVAVAPAAPAYASTSNPRPGLSCGLLSVTNPTAESFVETGVLVGGPLAVLDDAGNVGGGTLTCTVQLSYGTHGDTTNDTYAVSASGTGVVVMVPQLFSYVNVGRHVYVCTQFKPSDGSATLYWSSPPDDALPTATGYWTTSRNASCDHAIGMTPADALGPCGPSCDVVPIPEDAIVHLAVPDVIV